MPSSNTKPFWTIDFKLEMFLRTYSLSGKKCGINVVPLQAFNLLLRRLVYKFRWCLIVGKLWEEDPWPIQVEHFNEDILGYGDVILMLVLLLHRHFIRYVGSSNAHISRLLCQLVCMKFLQFIRIVTIWIYELMRERTAGVWFKIWMPHLTFSLLSGPVEWIRP